ncbi:MAG: PspC domain-containing protein [Bacteroidales bacterium]|jgi:phage shock protein PspC (stress-responsive transcriptional regulator)|nr:PspC domain-containing protein [Bacteroidales bacterium]
MKKVVTVGLGGRTFVIDEDAYQKLSLYLSRFRERTRMGLQSGDVMEDLEQRIAELFEESLGSRLEVVNINMVNSIISQLGMPDGEPVESDFTAPADSTPHGTNRKLFRDPDNKQLGGVCSGLAHYLNVDVVLMRVIFVIALFMGGTGFWAYIIFWIVAPMAYTAAQKCEMRGLPVTAENLRKFSNYK